MKKIIVLVAALSLILSAVPAMADGPLNKQKQRPEVDAGETELLLEHNHKWP